MGSVPANPASYTDGEIPPATKLNQPVTAAGFLLAPPTCVLTTTTTINPASGAATVQTFNTTTEDTDGMADLANNQIVCKTAGLYVLTGYLAFASNATGYRGALIYVNGAIVVSDYRPAVSGQATPIPVESRPFRLAVNDTVQLRGIQTSGGPLLTQITNGTAYLSARWCGR